VGPPLSPLLSNLLVDELDRELERRKHCIVRYASMMELIKICEEVSGAIINHTYGEGNRIGDHIWWITDTGKFSQHYPGRKQPEAAGLGTQSRSLRGGCQRIDQGKRNLLCVCISAVDYEYAVAKIMDAAKKGSPLRHQSACGPRSQLRRHGQRPPLLFEYL
jgi:hypothetical protein